MTTEANLSRSSVAKWGVLTLLVLTTATNIMDRQLPFIMAEPIRQEFDLSDAQLAMLGGLGFSLVYAFGAIPLARLADRRSRRLVIAGCIAAWSLFTALGSFARSYPQLVMTRSGVALGEAGAAPASHSLLSDLFHDGHRALALSINSAGLPLGVLLGMTLGGLLLEILSWRTVLLLAAIPGLLLALLFALVIAEPPRIGARAVEPPPFATALEKLWCQRSFIWLVMGATFMVFASTGGAAFGASFFIRVHHLSIGETGLVTGMILGLGGAFGSVVAGAVADRLTKRDARWALWLPALGSLIGCPFYIAAWLVDDLSLTIAFLLAAYFLGGSCLPMSYAATQAIAEPRMRALSSAVTQLVVNLLGNVAGPLAAGFLSDRLTTTFGVRSLGMALAICGAFLLLSALCFWRAASFHRQDLAARRHLDELP